MASIINAATSGGLISTADTSGILQLQTASTTAVTVDASQNVGIGTTSPTRKLTISGTGAFSSTAAPSIRLDDTASSRFAIIDVDSSQNLNFWNSDAGSGSTRFYRGSGSGTLSMSIDGAGNLGLGVTPSAWGSNYRAMEFGDSDNQSFFSGQTNANVVLMGTNTFHDNTNYKYKFNGYASFYLQFNGEHRWSIAPSGTAGNAISFTQAMTLDASGNLGVGTTSPTNRVSIVTASGSDGIVSVKSPLTETAGVVIDGGTSSNKGSVLKFSKNASVLWQMGTDSAIIGSTSDNFHLYGGGANAILFSTNATERARIDSSGNLLVGASSFADGSNVFRISGSTISSGSSVTSTRTRLEFNSSGLGTVGSISTNGSATTYSTSSDYRLKNTIAPMAGALAKVALLKPCTYKWNADGSNGEGFIAHELAEVCPDAVVGIKDAVDENGNPIHQGIDTSFLVATLTAAIQEQQALIQSLKARLDAANL